MGRYSLVAIVFEIDRHIYSDIYSAVYGVRSIETGDADYICKRQIISK